MKLLDGELNQLKRQGFLTLPERFSLEEVQTIKSRLPSLFAEKHPGNIKEKESQCVRTSMGLHKRDNVFERLVSHPKLVAPAKQIYSEPLYIQQVKVNVKAAFSGEVWQWHYDFATHREEDGVEKPLAVNLHIFLDDVTEFNGPIYFIPQSHKYGDHEALLDKASTSYPLWVVSNEVVKSLVESHGIVSATGKKGTVLIFFDTIVHGSPGNMSPWDRSIFSLIVNPVSNPPLKPTRPDYKHHLDFNPINPLDDNCLMQKA
tara:strand:+ start:226 stop:1005 length:780 start_codon:yes stop_codon:yes gene_type:complete